MCVNRSGADAKLLGAMAPVAGLRKKKKLVYIYDKFRNSTFKREIFL